MLYEATGVKVGGNWDRNFLCGVGIITWPDGNTLELEWKAGVPTSNVAVVHTKTSKLIPLKWFLSH